MFYATVSLVLTLLLLLTTLCWRWKYYKLIFKIPGPLGFPILGMAHKFYNKEEMLYILAEFTERYGPVLFSWLGPMPFLLISDPQTVEDILTSPDCTDKSIIYAAVNDTLGEGLFSLNGAGWSKHRKLLNPAFRRSVIHSFLPIFNEEINRLMKSMDALVGSGAVNLTEMLTRFSLCSTLRTTMGLTPSQDNQNCDYAFERVLNCYARMLKTLAQVMVSPWLTNRSVRVLFGMEQSYVEGKTHIRQFMQSKLEEKLLDKKPDGTTVEDTVNGDKTNVLDIAVNLHKKGSFTVREVEDELNVIIFGAFETTANAVAYTLMLLAMHPEQQQKAFDEVSGLFPERGHFEVTHGDIQQLVYIDMILSESMRLLAPVPLVARKTTRPVRLSTGVLLPEGIQIAINIFHMHRRTDIWGPTAHTFDPEHFLPSNLEGKHSFAYIPFTKGKRDCIGRKYALLAAKATLVKLIRNYYFTTDYQLSDLHFLDDITLKFKRMPLLEIHARTA